MTSVFPTTGMVIINSNWRKRNVSVHPLEQAAVDVIQAINDLPVTDYGKRQNEGNGMARSEYCLQRALILINNQINKYKLPVHPLSMACNDILTVLTEYATVDYAKIQYDETVLKSTDTILHSTLDLVIDQIAKDNGNQLPQHIIVT